MFTQQTTITDGVRPAAPWIRPRWTSISSSFAVWRRIGARAAQAAVLGGPSR
jgi:hypothetical protein